MCPGVNFGAHTLLVIPNRISDVDFEGWIFRKDQNRIIFSTDESVATSVKTMNLPLLLTKTQGKGKITYTDLALHYKWLNVYPGSYKIIASLISY